MRVAKGRAGRGKVPKRTPLLCVPEHQRNQMRDTPWGYISYLDYRYKVEFDKEGYDEIDRYAEANRHRLVRFIMGYPFSRVYQL